MKDITFPKGLEHIGEHAFEGCGVTVLNLPEGLKSIGKYAFFGCKNLKAVMLPEKTPSIDGGVFWECNQLTCIPLGIYAEEGEGYRSDADGFVIRNGVLTEYSGSGENVVVPSGVIAIKEHAFSNYAACKDVRSVIIPEGVVSISIGATGFYGKALEYAVLPESFVKVRDRAFYFNIHVGNMFRSCSKFQALLMPARNYTALCGPALPGKSDRNFMVPNFALFLRGENGLRILAFSEEKGVDTLKEYVDTGNWLEYDRELLNPGLRFKFKPIVRVLGALGRLSDPVELTEENRIAYSEMVKKNVKKLIPMAEELHCPELVRMLFGVGVMSEKTEKSVRKLLDASEVPEIAALADAEAEL